MYVTRNCFVYLFFKFFAWLVIFEYKTDELSPFRHKISFLPIFYLSIIITIFFCLSFFYWDVYLFCYIIQFTATRHCSPVDRAAEVGVVYVLLILEFRRRDEASSGCCCCCCYWCMGNKQYLLARLLSIRNTISGKRSWRHSLSIRLYLFLSFLTLFTLSLSLSHTHTHIHTYTHAHSFSVSHTYTHSYYIILSVMHTHTHTHTHT